MITYFTGLIVEVSPLASKFTPSFLNYTKISTEFTQTLNLVLMLMKIIVNLCFQLKVAVSRGLSIFKSILC